MRFALVADTQTQLGWGGWDGWRGWGNSKQSWTRDRTEKKKYTAREGERGRQKTGEDTTTNI